MSSTPTAPASGTTAKDRFLTFLSEIEDGAFMDTCGAELQKLVRELSTLRAAGLSKVGGEITLVLKVKNDGGVFDVIADHKVKMPKRPKQRSVMYADRIGSLTARNPDLSDRPLRDVTAGSGSLRSI